MNCLREAGELLRAVADADDRMLISRRMLDVAYRLDGLRLAEASGIASVVAAPASPHRPKSNGEIVPIESLLYDERAQPSRHLSSRSSRSLPTSRSKRRPPTTMPASGLERSYRTYDRLRRERPVAPSLERSIGWPEPAAPTSPPQRTPSRHPRS